MFGLLAKFVLGKVISVGLMIIIPAAFASGWKTATWKADARSYDDALHALSQMQEAIYATTDGYRDRIEEANQELIAAALQRQRDTTLMADLARRIDGSQQELLDAIREVAGIGVGECIVTDDFVRMLQQAIDSANNNTSN